LVPGPAGGRAAVSVKIVGSYELTDVLAAAI